MTTVVTAIVVAPSDDSLTGSTAVVIGRFPSS